MILMGCQPLAPCQASSAAMLAVVFALKTSLQLAGQFFVHVVRPNLKCLLSVQHSVLPS
jgi:hypothetical protein